MDWLFETMDLRVGKDEMATIRPVVSTGEGASSLLMGAPYQAELVLRIRPGEIPSPSA
jgi:hypothetical protein